MTRTDQQSSQTQQLFSSLAAGGIAAVISISVSISMAALIFSGPLKPWLPVGLGAILVGGILMRVVMALRSRLQVPLGTPLVEQLLLIAAASAAMQGAFPDLAPDALMKTLMAGVVGVTLLTGGALVLLGTLKVGRWFAVLPSLTPAIFIAATGGLLIEGGLRLGFSETATAQLLEAHPALWPGLCSMGLAVVLVAVTRLIDRPLALPIAVLAMLFISIATNTVLQLDGNWLLGPFPSQSGLPDLGPVALGGWNSEVLLAGWMSWLSIPFVTLLSLVLSVKGLGAIFSQDVDLDHELRVTGVANLASGGLGGTMGSVVLPDAALAHTMGARGPLVAIIGGLSMGLVLIVAPELLGQLPRPVFGGLVLFLALSLLGEGFGRARTQGWAQVGIIGVALAGVFVLGFLESVVCCTVLAAVLSRATKQSDMSASASETTE